MRGKEVLGKGEERQDPSEVDGAAAQRSSAATLKNLILRAERSQGES